jgi:hypothetical protein
MLVFILISECSLEPWIKPYERAHIADPIMSFDRDPVSSAYISHVHESREGARGTGASTGGGFADFSSNSITLATAAKPKLPVTATLEP